MNAIVKTGPPRRSQQEKRAESQKRIFDAAVQLVSERGSKKTTMSDIAKLSGYSHGLVMQRFGSKNQLINEIAKETQNNFVQQALIPHLKGKVGLEAILGLIDAFFTNSYFEKNPKRNHIVRAFYVLLGEAIAEQPEIKATFYKADLAFRQLVKRKIDEGIANKEIRSDVCSHEASVYLVGLLRGVAMQRFVDPDCVESEMIRTAIKSLVHHSLKASDR